MYHLSLRLLVNMICRIKKKGLRNGHNQRGGGGLKCAPNSEKEGIRCGSGKKGGLYRRTYVYWTYVSSPTDKVGSGTTEKYGTWTLLSD